MIWKLGVLGVDDPRMVKTMDRLRSTLAVRTPIGGFARYTTDYYQSVTPPTGDIPGNPWIITTLWDAQWTIARAKTTNDLQAARPLLQWALQHASASGILPEQVHPLTGAPLSVAPLTWSHATYVETILHYLAKEKELRS